jgi:membrane associated rhomboid family serine protease
VPQVSFTGHISGFITGLVLGLAFCRAMAPLPSARSTQGMEEQT